LKIFQKLKAEWDRSAEEPKTRKLYSVGVWTIGGLVMFLVLMTCWKQFQVWREARALQEEVRLGPRVQTAKVTKSSGEDNVILVGETRPFATATLYAKISGYLSEIKVDKGDIVKKNQVLGIVNSPETSKQYQAALADSQNKHGIANRMKELISRKLVSQQEADQAFSDSDIAEAKLEQMAILKGYEVLRAPFDGTVTARYVDAGILIQDAQNAQTSAQPVVTISQVNTLRIYVYLDQRDAYYVKKSDPAKISLTERPELSVAATVTRVSGELDARTRMMLVEVDVDNSQGLLVAGSLVNVSLNIKLPIYPQVPVEAVVIRDGKLYAPVVSPEGSIHYQLITAGHNDGQRVQILSGLKEGDVVALDVGNSIVEGSHIRVIASEEEKHPAAPTAPARNGT
jgi:membrane fusion protein, multidrug efflux system